MFSRRDALKLGAAGLLTPVAGLAPFGSGVLPANAQRSTMHGPVLDRPIVVKWTYETGAEYGSTPVIEDGVAYGSAPDSHVYALDAQTGEELWRQTGSPGYSTPIFHAGLAIFATSPGGIVALDTGSGSQQWRFETSDRANFTPIINQGVVYFAEQYGDLYALDATTGTEKWRTTVTRDEWFSVQSFTFWNDTAFAITDDPRLVALDLNSGTEIWSLDAESDRFNSPVLDNGVLYFSGANALYALDAATGNPIWQFTGESSGYYGPILENGVLYWSVTDGPLSAIDAVSGEMIWQNSAGGYGATSFGIDGSTLVYHLATGGQMFPFYTLHGIDKSSGQEIWRTEEIWDQMLPSFPGDGTVVVGQYHTRDNIEERPLYALDIATGAEIWRMTRSGGFTNRAAFSDGNIYVGAAHGTVYCLGNLPPAILATDVTLRGAPSATGIERGVASAGDEIDRMGSRNDSAGQEWVEVTIGDATGWIPFEAIDPATLAPEGEVEYVFVPN